MLQEGTRILVIGSGAIVSGLVKLLATTGNDVIVVCPDNTIRGTLMHEREPIVMFDDFTFNQANGREEKRVRKFARRTRTEGWDNAEVKKCRSKNSIKA